MRSRELLRVEGLHLAFKANIQRSWTWREAFTRVVHDPIGAFTAEQDRLHVLNGINFTVKAGDRVALVGANGSGKTSLCRCIAGIYRPNKGSVRSQGLVRAIFDTAVGILPELTGRENAYLLATFLYPEEHSKLDAIVGEALEFSELGQFLDMPFKLYSNGMQARLCLSIISCLPCDLLILDEVFDGADIFFKEKISKRILKMIEASGAVVFVSHSVEQVETVCNRLVLVQGGKIAFDGAVKEGLAAYLKSNQAGKAPY
jgi:ABC-type polysaccharide/polyol phosphate transport system ATPase subunit